MNSRSALAWSMLLFCLVLAAFLPKAVEKSLHSDFERYYFAGKAALVGKDIYEAEGHLQFKYLPFFAQIMQPFAACEQKTAAILWYLTIAGSFAAMLVLSLKLLPSNKQLVLSGVIVLLITGRYFVNNARLGQINMLAAFLALAGAFLVLKKKERAGGLLTAFAACLKFMPVFLLIFYAWKKRPQAAIYGLLGILLGVFVIPAFTWGWQGNVTQLRNYLQRRSKMVSSVAKNDAPGESLPALCNRVLRKVPANNYKERKQRHYYINVADWSVSRVNALVAILLFFLIASVAWFTCPSRRDLSVYELGVVFCLLLLISPESRNAHFINLLLPVVLVVNAVLSRVPVKGKSIAFLFCLVLLTMGTSSGVLGAAGSSYASAFAAAGVAAFILALVCARLLLAGDKCGLGQETGSGTFENG